MRVIDNAGEDEEETHSEIDIIELMGYKDAHSVLGLRAGANGGAIREAYEANRATIEQSIQKMDEQDEQTSSANIGQMNYLQLKLQALDQALSELSDKGQLASRIPEQTRTQRFAMNTQDDDDLACIDIYFNANRKKAAPRAKSPSSDFSSISGISGSSIFSFVSEGVRQIKDDISESGLSDLLGPLPEEVPEEKKHAAPSTRPHYKRPPLANREPKQRKVKSQVSPTSVIFEQNIHRSLEYDNSSASPGNQTVGRGKVMERMMRDSRRARATCENSNRANIEAARHGIIKAISEDDSECITLDTDFISRRSHPSSFEASSPVEARHVSRQPATDENSDRYFSGKTDRVGDVPNSILRDTKARRQSPVSSPAGSLSSASKSKPSTMSSRGNRKARERIRSSTSQWSTPAYDGSIVTSENEDYDIFQSGLDMADELCTALQSCWSNDTASTPKNNRHAALDSVDDCTYNSKETYGEESTYAHTEGESTAFNTQSSMSQRQQDSPLLRNSGNSLRHDVSSSPADPPPQMYV